MFLIIATAFGVGILAGSALLSYGILTAILLAPFAASLFAVVAAMVVMFARKRAETRTYAVDHRDDVGLDDMIRALQTISMEARDGKTYARKREASKAA